MVGCNQQKTNDGAPDNATSSTPAANNAKPETAAPSEAAQKAARTKSSTDAYWSSLIARIDQFKTNASDTTQFVVPEDMPEVTNDSIKSAIQQLTVFDRWLVHAKALKRDLVATSLKDVNSDVVGYTSERIAILAEAIPVIEKRLLVLKRYLGAYKKAEDWKNAATGAIDYLITGESSQYKQIDATIASSARELDKLANELSDLKTRESRLVGRELVLRQKVAAEYDLNLKAIDPFLIPFE